MSIDTRKSKRIRIKDISIDPVTLASYETLEQQKRIESMAKNLEKKGQLQPIIVNPDFTTIWRGHTRYLAAKKLKREYIDAIIMNAEE